MFSEEKEARSKTKKSTKTLISKGTILSIFDKRLPIHYPYVQIISLCVYDREREGGERRGLFMHKYQVFWINNENLITKEAAAGI